MGLYTIYRFHISIIFIVILLTNVVRLHTMKRDVTLSSAEPQADANHSGSFGRIVNGSAATLGQFPHQVSLRNTLTEKHFCGGSIIAKEWILTAAHCMFLKTGTQLQPWQITVVAGDIWLNYTSPTSQRSVITRILIHENYESSTLRNDITLLKLAQAFKFDHPTVEYQRLQIIPVSDGTICQVAGWGYPAAYIHEVTNELMYIQVPIIGRKICANLYKGYSNIPDGMICAGYISGKIDACQGDSGGGMICEGMLTGIVSWGEGCAMPNYPGVYTDVRYYRDWIIDRISTNKKSGNGANPVGFSSWVKMFLFAVIGFRHIHVVVN